MNYKSATSILMLKSMIKAQSFSQSKAATEQNTSGRVTLNTGLAEPLLSFLT